MKPVLLVSLTLILFASSIQPVLAGPSGPVAIPDGEWQGSLSAYYEWDFVGVSGVWTWGGEMHFFSTAGELTGESGITGSGSGESGAAMGIGTVNANVAIFGPSFEPQFQATGGVLDITVGSGGLSQNMSFPIETSEAVPVKLTTVTCSQVTGDWDEFMNQFAAKVGGSLTNLSTIFAAVRTADLAPEGQSNYQEELNELVNQANEFITSVKTTQFMDTNALLSLLTRAEELAISLRKNNDCGFTKDWSFALPIASLVSQLIDFAAANPSYFTNYDVFLLSEAAVRTGLIGAGAVNPDLANNTKTKLSGLITGKLNDLASAGGTGDCQALMPLWIAAHNVGGAVQTQAEAQFSSAGC